MMLIVSTVASALFASVVSAAGAPAPSTSAIPPMIVNVTASDDVSPSLAARVLAETDAIWRASGVTFAWRRAPTVVVPYSRAGEAGPYVPKTLRVTIGGNRGAGADGRRALGWIVFDDDAAPQQEIYLSHVNALAMMEEARGVVGLIAEMPAAQRETLLGRAMGRALAHELGHYLLASKAHTSRGLMKAVLTAVELFMPDSSGFRIEPAQRRIIASRLSVATEVARR